MVCSWRLETTQAIAWTGLPGRGNEGTGILVSFRFQVLEQDRCQIYRPKRVATSIPFSVRETH